MKHPRLPNGLGHIKYLGKGRSNPYAVYPPEYGMNYSYKKALCYVPDWYTAFAVLMAHKAGTYKPGDEIDIIRQMKPIPEWEMNDLAKKILSDYRMIGAKKEDILKSQKHKFCDLYDAYMESRFGEYATSKFSPNTKQIYEINYQHLAPIHKMYIEDITVDDLQDVVNKLADKLAHATIKNVIGVCSAVYSYALSRGYIQRSLTPSVKIPVKAREQKHAEAYSDEDLKKIWAAARDGDKIAIEIIEQTYTGFRIGAMYDLIFDFEKLLIYGGVKTGKRTVPMHHALVPFFYAHPKPPCGRTQMVTEIKKLCRRLNIPEIYSTHSARHTFKRLCDKYSVNPIASRLMMGHTLGRDVHDNVYTHWGYEDLRKEIEKIVVFCAD